ncbi:hypothetical protein PHMEG_00014506 [Phytophthora megakarya]|uniref:Uncharacterized protein n=1 Tax=Phytophthora megakarya TaxID=4795 RepID=A0A225W589_9STRA|nr:hypothetical protein PHMEG_00014506 [Phytophthora megakarya]
MDVTHPFQVQRQLWPDHACLFNTKNFDLDSHVSQCASYPDRLLGIWRRLRGYGDRDSASLGVADYERKHWVPAKAVERMFAIMEENISKQTNWSKRERKHALATLDELRRQWAEYHDERASRADNLRQFILNRLWLWCSPDKEFSQPTPCWSRLCPFTLWKSCLRCRRLLTADWCAEALELGRQEPWRTLTLPGISLSVEILRKKKKKKRKGKLLPRMNLRWHPFFPGSPALSSASNETMDLDKGSDADTPLDEARGAEMLAQLYPGETVEL